MNFNLHTSTLFAVAAFAAIPAFGQRTAEQVPDSNPTAHRIGSDPTESVTKIEARRAGMVHGHDFASPAPAGRRTLADPTPEVFTGLTDEELASSKKRGASFAPDRSRVYYDQSADGTWIRGRNYKAHAAADGFTFIPFVINVFGGMGNSAASVLQYLANQAFRNHAYNHVVNQDIWVGIKRSEISHRISSALAHTSSSLIDEALTRSQGERHHYMYRDVWRIYGSRN